MKYQLLLLLVVCFHLKCLSQNWHFVFNGGDSSTTMCDTTIFGKDMNWVLSKLKYGDSFNESVITCTRDSDLCLPDTYFRFTNLEHIELFTNGNITCIDNRFSSFNKLLLLDIFCKSIDRINPSLGELDSLQGIQLHTKLKCSRKVIRDIKKIKIKRRTKCKEFAVFINGKEI